MQRSLFDSKICWHKRTTKESAQNKTFKQEKHTTSCRDLVNDVVILYPLEMQEETLSAKLLIGGQFPFLTWVS